MTGRTKPLNGSLDVLLVHDGQAAWSDIEKILRQLGHHVWTLQDTSRSEPDIVINVAGSNGAIPVVQELRRSGCPVVSFVADAPDRLLRSAAYAGVAVYVLGEDRNAWAKVVEVALRPFAAMQELEGALQRRAVIERAKGVLMERRAIRERDAFELLRREARNTNRRVVDVAAAVLDGHLLLRGNEKAAQGAAVELMR
jgi:AmiR/NasT family two-component response regulator